MTGMGRRKRVDGDEQDAYSRRWRRMFFWKTGQLAKVKRGTHKRERKDAKRQIRSEAP